MSYTKICYLSFCFEVFLNKELKHKIITQNSSGGGEGGYSVVILFSMMFFASGNKGERILKHKPFAVFPVSNEQ